MRGINSNLLKTLLQFLYSGFVEVEEEKLNQFVDLAEDLGLEGLGQRHSEEEKPCLEKTLQVQDEKKTAAKAEPNVVVEPPGRQHFERDNLFHVKMVFFLKLWTKHLLMKI